MSTSVSTVDEPMPDTGQIAVSDDELQALSAQLERAGVLLRQLGENGRVGRAPTYESLGAALLILLNVRGRLYHGTKPELTGSARSRILHYLEAHEGEAVSADELNEVAGIRAWARRIRELREEGHDIEHVGDGRYRLNRSA